MFCSVKTHEGNEGGA